MSWKKALSTVAVSALLGVPLQTLGDNNRNGHGGHDRDAHNHGGHDRDAHNNKKDAALEAQLIAGYTALVGSSDNARSLVKGLRNDTMITLTSLGTPGTPGRDAIPGTPYVPAQPAVVCPPRPTPGCVSSPGSPEIPAVPGQPAIEPVPGIPGEKVTFYSPTRAMKYKQVKTALWFMHAKLMEMDNTMTVAKPTQVREALVGDTGILTMRAKHMSWHQVARRQGFSFVTHQGDGKHHDLDDDNDD